MSESRQDQVEITEDEPCEKCGYNLRGLRVGGKCPECGREIAATTEWEPLDAETIERERLDPLRPVAEKLNVSVEAVEFVVEAMRFTSNRARRAGRVKPHFSAQEFVWGLRDFALEKFGGASNARDALLKLGLNRSEDVGAIVFALVRVKLAQTQPNDRVEEFNGLFVVENLFSR